MTFYRRRRRYDQWLDLAATADQIVGYSLAVAFACGVIVLILEMVR